MTGLLRPKTTWVLSTEARSATRNILTVSSIHLALLLAKCVGLGKQLLSYLLEVKAFLPKQLAPSPSHSFPPLEAQEKSTGFPGSHVHNIMANCGRVRCRWGTQQNVPHCELGSRALYARCYCIVCSPFTLAFADGITYITRKHTVDEQRTTELCQAQTE